MVTKLIKPCGSVNAILRIGNQTVGRVKEARHAARLDIGEPDCDPPQSLSGDYSTDRLTHGELAVTARTTTLAPSFDQARALCPAVERPAE